MESKLVRLAIERAIELGALVYEKHQLLEKWREPAFTPVERTRLCVDLQKAIEEQYRWLRAVTEELDLEQLRT